MTSNLLKTIFDIADVLNIPAVIIGGLALPAYNFARTTVDIDVCIYVKNQDDLNNYIAHLKSQGVHTNQNPKIDHDLFTVFSKSNEAEIWLKPCDAFNWDEEMLKRIKKFHDNYYVLSLEDYILTKLARADRSSTDIVDILYVLIANKDNINWQYLVYRLKWVNLVNDFKEILKGFKLDFDKNFRDISKVILEKLKHLD